MISNPIVKWISQVSEYGLEFASRRYYGLYGSQVESNEDSRQQGRVSARIGVLGIGTRDPAGKFTPSVHSKMLRPITPYAGLDHGIYFPPEDGDIIYVSFDHGDPECPRHVGSSWPNPEAAKTAAGSFLPSEFKSEGPPTKRGIKTKYGHGLIFSDTDDEPFVTLWSGTQQNRGEEALKQQQISLVNDGGSKDSGIYTDTFYGHRVHLNDKKRSITISGAATDPEALLSNSVKIEDETGKVLVKTVGPQAAAHYIELDDSLSMVTIKSKGQQSITINDIGGVMNVTATGALILSATGGIAMGSGAAPPAGAPGVAIETGAGAKIINFVGAVTETLGSFTQTALTVVINATTSMIVNTTIFNVNSPAISLGTPGFGIVLFGGFITIGNPVTAKQVTNAELIEFLKTHTHVGNTGAPTPLSPADVILLQDPLNAALPNPLYVSQTKMA